MYLSLSDLLKRGIPHSDRQLRRLEAANKFPKRVKLSRGHVAWIDAEIDQWERDRNAARGAGKRAA